jgi:hypothetical protein
MFGAGGGGGVPEDVCFPLSAAFLMYLTTVDGFRSCLLQSLLSVH